jgi:hypothetical protein
MFGPADSLKSLITSGKTPSFYAFSILYVQPPEQRRAVQHCNNLIQYQNAWAPSRVAEGVSKRTPRALSHLGLAEDVLNEVG